MDISAATSSSQAIQRAFDRNAGRAARIADPENDPTFEKDMAELPSDRHAVGAQIKAIKTRDEMLGDLLDIVA